MQAKSAQGTEMLSIQCKMARAATGLGVRELAELSKVSADTIVRFERGEELRPRTVDAIRVALEAAGVEFIPENGGGAGVRLRLALPRLVRRNVSRFDREANFIVSYRSVEYRVKFSTNILDDLDRTNYETDDQYQSAFDNHVNEILTATAGLIDAAQDGLSREIELKAGDFA